jgi:hypothetical protein
MRTVPNLTVDVLGAQSLASTTQVAPGLFAPQLAASSSWTSDSSLPSLSPLSLVTPTATDNVSLVSSPCDVGSGEDEHGGPTASTAGSSQDVIMSQEDTCVAAGDVSLRAVKRKRASPEGQFVHRLYE